MSILPDRGPVKGPPVEIPFDFITGPQTATMLAIPFAAFAEMERSGTALPLPSASVGVRLYNRIEMLLWNKLGRPPLHRWHELHKAASQLDPQDLLALSRAFAGAIMGKAGVA